MTEKYQKLYIVWEENHGDVAWFLDKDRAQCQVTAIVVEGYENDPDAEGDCVGIREVYLDKMWR